MKKSINKQQLILEFISVVFAVILALILNSWRESLSINENLVKVKASIIQETIKNDSLVRASHTYRGNLLQQLYSNTYELLSSPTSDFPVDVNNNNDLAEYFRTSLIFGSKDYYERVLVLQEESNRVLVLDKRVFDIVVENDTIKLLGVGNIEIKSPELSNRSYNLAQATETIVKMDMNLVEKLSSVNSLIENYIKTNDHAVEVVYSGNQKGIISVMEDMYSIEAKIIKANEGLLDALK
ncbi:hypothetical protein [Fulvivirga lutimaris]|uniref:hypothetical protein n=1 Tax=Fulvivirga lutimaris TaxID=1819566 RepID=UPI0012BBEDC5|nr:hypothetical protein [Fulvivirga lutimaris]MTI38175.1 hypothetical protein [Fulvivirga lutimaris]